MPWCIAGAVPLTFIARPFQVCSLLFICMPAFVGAFGKQPLTERQDAIRKMENKTALQGQFFVCLVLGLCLPEAAPNKADEAIKKKIKLVAC